MNFCENCGELHSGSHHYNCTRPGYVELANFITANNIRTIVDASEWRKLKQFDFDIQGVKNRIINRLDGEDLYKIILALGIYP